MLRKFICPSVKFDSSLALVHRHEVRISSSSFNCLTVGIPFLVFCDVFILSFEKYRYFDFEFGQGRKYAS